MADLPAKIQALLPVIHALTEEKRGMTFILTGSSSRKLKRTGADLLGGRAVVRAMHPFMAAEISPGFDLDRALRHGLLPLVWKAKDPEDILRAFAALYVREEVQMEGLVRNVGNFVTAQPPPTKPTPSPWGRASGIRPPRGGEFSVGGTILQLDLNSYGISPVSSKPSACRSPAS